MSRIIPRNGNTKGNRGWTSFSLEGFTLLDTNGLLQSRTEDALGTEIAILGGTACDQPADAITYIKDLKDSDGNDILIPDHFDAKFMIEIVSGATDASDVYVVAGITSVGHELTRGLLGGWIWDSAGGPSVRAGNCVANTDTGQSALHEKVVVDYRVMANTFQSVFATSYDGANNPVSSATRGSSTVTSGKVRMFVSIGRKTATVGTETIKFKITGLELRKADNF
jgi:hypothetical protein